MTSYMQNPLVLNPESSHLPYAFTDAALLHALFSLAGMHHDLSIGRSITPTCLMHRGETLRLVNERITKTPLQLDDGTIGAVAALATFDVSQLRRFAGVVLMTVNSYWMVDSKVLVGIFEDFNEWLFKEAAYKSSERRPGMFADHGYCKGLYVGKKPVLSLCFLLTSSKVRSLLRCLRQ